MVRRALYQIAGVDRATLETCPATDKLWAAQLGFSLCLSFVVVLGISFHATSYVISNLFARALASLVIALTVFMFDRALYQSDWFYQGFLWRSAPGADDDASGGRSAKRFLRIAVRLAMSFGLAWVIAVFLELAIFSDTITDKIKRDHVTINQPVYQKIDQYEDQLGKEIEQRRSTLASLETLLRSELTGALVPETPERAPFDDFEQQIKTLDAQEAERRNELRQIQESIRTYAADMNAEELGQRLNANNSGRVGTGPRFQFAKRQKEVYEEQRAAKESEIAQLRAKRDDLRNTQIRIAAEFGARRNQLREAAQSKRDVLQAQIEVARADLKRVEDSRLLNVEEFRRKALAASDFQKQKDDPLSRMTAYQELKSDPKDGATVTLFSWMTKFLIIFLEIVPIVAKLFFSPPSVYAAKIQSEVERERRRVQRERQRIMESEIELERRTEEIAASEAEERAHRAEPLRSKSSELPVEADASIPSSLPQAPSIARQPESKQKEGVRVATSRVKETKRETPVEEDRRRDLDRLISQAEERRAKGQPEKPRGRELRLLEPLIPLDVSAEPGNPQKQ